MLNIIFVGSLAAEGPQLPPHTPIATPRAGATNVRLTVLALVLAYFSYRYVQTQIKYRVWSPSL